MPPIRASHFAALFLSVSLVGQNLTLQGSNSQAFVPIGGTLDMRIAGPAGLPWILAVSPDPGPIVLPGLIIPIGPSGLVDLSGMLPFPTTGVEVRSFPIPDEPLLLGVVLHCVVGWIDPGTPLGVTISNGAAFQIVNRIAQAGADCVAFVNQEISLDGSSTPGLGSGALLQWSILGAPAGSSPLLALDQSAFPLFVADEPGEYWIELLTFGPGGISADHLRVAVYRLDIFSPPDGAFISAPTPIQGRLEGPPAGLLIDGLLTPLQTDGSFTSAPVPPPAVARAVVLSIVPPGGSHLDRTLPLFSGASDPIGAWTGPSQAIRESASVLASLELPIEQSLAQLPIGLALSLVPPVPFPPTVPATGSLDPLLGSALPGVDFEFLASTVGLGIQASWSGLSLPVLIQGDYQGQPLNAIATLSAQTVRLISELSIQGQPIGPPTVALANARVTWTGWSFTPWPPLPPPISVSELGEAVRAALEQELIGLSALVAPAVGLSLSGLSLQVDLSAQGLPILVQAPLAALALADPAMEIRYDFRVQPLAAAPTAPVVTAVRREVALLPALPTMLPGAGTPYDLAYVQTLPIWNQAAAALTVIGAFERDLGGQAAHGGLGLTAANLMPWLPGFGLEVLDPSVPILVHAELGAPPTVSPGPGGSRLHLSALKLAFSAEVAPQTLLPLFALGVDAVFPFSPSVDPLTSTLKPLLGPAQFSLSIERSLAGRAPTPAPGGIQTLLATLLPVLLAPFESIPLPLPDLSSASILAAGPSPLAPGAHWVFFDLP